MSQPDPTLVTLLNAFAVAAREGTTREYEAAHDAIHEHFASAIRTAVERERVKIVKNLADYGASCGRNPRKAVLGCIEVIEAMSRSTLPPQDRR